MRKVQIHSSSFLSRMDRIEAKNQVRQKDISNLHHRKMQFLVLKLGKQNRLLKAKPIFQFELESFYQKLNIVLNERSISLSNNQAY